MKINFDQELKNLKGETLKYNDTKEKMTLKSSCIDALLGMYQDEQIKGEEKALRADLAQKIYKAEAELEVSIEEVAKIKKLVGKAHTPLVVGQVYNLLEGK